jgi:hypothetical protein
MSPQDHNPYYDSVRDKPDRSEFGSLRMPMQEKRPPPGGTGFLKIVWVVIALVVLAVLAKRFLFA